MLKTYDELLDIAYQKGLYVFENQPLAHLRGFIFFNKILLREGLTEIEKRAVLTEEILHFDRDFGDITRNLRAEVRTHRKLIEENISLRELIDTIIDNKENGTPLVNAESLEIPVWLYQEAIEYYSILPYRNLEYRECIITFNPFHVYPKEDFCIF